MTTLLFIDPGKTTGAALGYYDAITPYRRIDAWEIQGGLRGFLEWWENINLGAMGGSEVCKQVLFAEKGAEKFVPISHGSFSHTLDSTLPLVIEGALITLGLMPDYPDPAWRSPAKMYFMGAPGDSLATKKKKAQTMLKAHSLWATGKEHGHTDGADVVSATLHSIAYLRDRKHAPTLRAFSPPRLAA